MKVNGYLGVQRYPKTYDRSTEAAKRFYKNIQAKYGSCC